MLMLLALTGCVGTAESTDPSHDALRKKPHHDPCRHAPEICGDGIDNNCNGRIDEKRCTSLVPTDAGMESDAAGPDTSGGEEPGPVDTTSCTTESETLIDDPGTLRSGIAGGIILDGDRILLSAGKLYQIPRTGGLLSVVDESLEIRFLTRDGGSLLWTANNGNRLEKEIWELNLSTHAARRIGVVPLPDDLARPLRVWLAADSANIYTSANREIGRLARDTGRWTHLYTAPGTFGYGPESLVADAEYLYWGGAWSNGIERMSKSGGTPTSISPDTYSLQVPRHLVLVGAHVYYGAFWNWEIGGARIFRTAVDGSSTEDLGPAGYRDHIITLAVDQDRIYHFGRETDYPPYLFASLPLSGGDDTVLIPDGRGGAGMDFDDSCVYWHDVGRPVGYQQILRIRK